MALEHSVFDIMSSSEAGYTLTAAFELPEYHPKKKLVA